MKVEGGGLCPARDSNAKALANPAQGLLETLG